MDEKDAIAKALAAKSVDNLMELWRSRESLEPTDENMALCYRLEDAFRWEVVRTLAVVRMEREAV